MAHPVVFSTFLAFRPAMGDQATPDHIIQPILPIPSPLSPRRTDLRDQPCRCREETVEASATIASFACAPYSFAGFTLGEQSVPLCFNVVARIVPGVKGFNF
jgi:hypothetical protein